MSPEPAAVRGISAVTLATHDMGRAVGFYQALGLPLQYGREDAGFTSFALGSDHLNLIAVDAARAWAWWGRVIVYVENVDDFYRRVVLAVARALGPPRATGPACDSAPVFSPSGSGRRPRTGARLERDHR